MYTDPVPNIAEHQEQTEITKTAPEPCNNAKKKKLKKRNPQQNDVKNNINGNFRASNPGIFICI